MVGGGPLAGGVGSAAHTNQGKGFPNVHPG